MSEDFIPTRCSRKKQNEEINVEVVVHKSYKSKRKQAKPENYSEISKSTQPVPELPTNEINMKRARFEIIKFGMSGFNKQKKEEAKVQLAIKLGAKPPKNKYTNYKQLLKERKKEKIREERQKQRQQQGKIQLTRTLSRKKVYDKKHKKEKGLLEVYGKVKVLDNK